MDEKTENWREKAIGSEFDLPVGISPESIKEPI